MKQVFKKNRLLIGILLLGAFFRFYGIFWDSGFHFHPDERMISMVAKRIHFPEKEERGLFWSAESPYNPKFFAYGSLPIYLLYWGGELGGVFNPVFKSYDFLSITGRLISILFDIGTIILVYKTGRKVFGKIAGLMGAFFYSICVFCIQDAHFYTVDGVLTFFIMYFLWRCLLFWEKEGRKKVAILGTVMGIILATKMTGVLAVSGVIGVFLLLLINKKAGWERFFSFLGIFFAFSIFSFLFFEPYAIIDFGEFKKQILAQIEMNKSAFTFPYTLQYVESDPYLYYLKNMVLWGMGLVLGTAGIIGAVWVSLKAAWGVIKARRGKKIKKDLGYLLILLSFFWVYFLVIGKSAVKFMRYFLPLYPLFLMFGGYLVIRINGWLRKKVKGAGYFIMVFVFLISVLWWPFSFIEIYKRANSRITASVVINENIGKGAVLGIEHWDDRLPVFGQEKYKFIELPMYERETKSKWDYINGVLEKIDYIIIASNRLYRPLMKLNDIYPKTAKYYQDLFSERMGFKKVAEITSYPKVPFLGWEIRDDEADESFTVYDHPKIIIFKKVD